MLKIYSWGFFFARQCYVSTRLKIRGGLKLLQRTVDDSLLLFRSRSHIQQFLNYLNSQHSLKNCTREVERETDFFF